MGTDLRAERIPWATGECWNILENGVLVAVIMVDPPSDGFETRIFDVVTDSERVGVGPNAGRCGAAPLDERSVLDLWARWPASMLQD
jgi:hypothetical protein